MPDPYCASGPLKRYTEASRGKRWNACDRIRQQGHRALHALRRVVVRPL
jgi:hypothetical protein